MKNLVLAATLLGVAACAATSTSSAPSTSPIPETRVGLRAGLTDAAEAVANLKVVSKTSSPPGFDKAWNSDITFMGTYAIQGSFNGIEIWDMANAASPRIVATVTCPASQNDVSVYRNLLFVSVESNNTNVDCAGPAITDTVSAQRMRGIRVFDISDIRNPKLIKNVQTCRGSHTHSVLEDPRDRENVYIYVSGSAGMRSPRELEGCTTARPDSNPNSALWRIEIIRVPLANPAAAAVVKRADIFTGLKAAPAHGPAAVDLANNKRVADSARAAGGFVAKLPPSAGGQEIVLGPGFIRPRLDSIVKARGGAGYAAATAADTAALRAGLQGIIDRLVAGNAPPTVPGVSPISTFQQCHDITVYPARGIAGGACEGHGILLDISDPLNPRRLDAVADSNFAYWHSATFNNDGTKILFSDEWGGGTAPRCRATDKKEWGANAIFDIVNGKMEFRSYYKIAAPQTDKENCVAHNGSMIPIPGRDVMVQAWYQGGISVFDFTDTRNPVEIAYFDRGPIDSTRMAVGGSWSAYWYNGTISSSEIARGIDNFQMLPSQYVSQNEIDASNTVKLAYFNAQGQPKFNWPPSYALSRAYVDQLERNKCLPKSRIDAVRKGLADAEKAGGSGRDALRVLATSLDGDMSGSCDKPKLMMLKSSIQDLSAPIVP
jgi:hypothetical protein